MAFASPRPGGRRWRFGDWPVAMQLTVGPVALLTVLVLTVGLALGVYFRTRTTSATVVATYDLLQDSAELTRLVIDQETGVRGFALARDEAFLEPYRRRPIAPCGPPWRRAWGASRSGSAG